MIRGRDPTLQDLYSISGRCFFFFVCHVHCSSLRYNRKWRTMFIVLASCRNSFFLDLIEQFFAILWLWCAGYDHRVEDESCDCRDNMSKIVSSGAQKGTFKVWSRIQYILQQVCSFPPLSLGHLGQNNKHICEDYWRWPEPKWHRWSQNKSSPGCRRSKDNPWNTCWSCQHQHRLLWSDGMQTPSSAAHEINSQGSYLPLFCLTKAVDEFIVLLFEFVWIVWIHVWPSFGKSVFSFSRAVCFPEAQPQDAGAGHPASHQHQVTVTPQRRVESQRYRAAAGEKFFPVEAQNITEMMSFLCKHAHFAEMIHWSAAISRNWPL